MIAKLTAVLALLTTCHALNVIRQTALRSNRNYFGGKYQNSFDELFLETASSSRPRRDLLQIEQDNEEGSVTVNVVITTINEGGYQQTGGSIDKAGVAVTGANAVGRVASADNVADFGVGVGVGVGVSTVTSSLSWPLNETST